MALNWTMLESTRNPVPLPAEHILSRESGVEVTIRIPNVPPQDDSSSGGSGGQARVLRESGDIWVTDQRFIFVSSIAHHSASGSKDNVETLSVPHTSSLSTSFVQPFFSSNYFSMEVQPTPDGGLTPGTVVEVRFKETGIFGWVGIIEHARARAIHQRQEERARMADPLPLYTPPPTQGGPVSTDQAARGPVTETAPVDGPPEYFA